MVIFAAEVFISMLNADNSLVTDVIVSGPGFRSSFAFTSIAAATTLVQELLRRRNNEDSEGFPIHDEDNHLIGFVVPESILCAVCQTRDRQIAPQDPVLARQLTLMDLQILFYQQQTGRSED